MSKTGCVEMTVLIERINRTVGRYAAVVTATVAAGVTLGTITAAQAATIMAFVNSLPALVAALKALTGY